MNQRNCSHREYIDMLQSAVYELLLIDALLDSPLTLTVQGAKAMKKRIEFNE